MSVLPQLSGRVDAVAPLAHPIVAGVDVIPYLPNRLVFANIVAQALESGAYTGVMVDLPSFMQRPGWLNAPLAALPYVSLATFVAADGSPRAVPFSPCAPAAVAALVTRRKAIALRCVEEANTLNHPLEHMFHPDIELREDYRVYQQGLEAFFAPAWHQLQEAWAGAGAMTRFFALQRGGSALQRVRTAAEGKRCLLVADYQLWWLMTLAAVARIPSATYLFPWKVPPRGLLFLPDPRDAWTHDLLDDYPAVTLEFWKHCLAAHSADSVPPPQAYGGSVIELPVRGARSPARGHPAPAGCQAPFDKRSVLDESLAQAASPPDSPTRTGSTVWTTRSMLAFVGYLRRLMAIHRRALPEAAAHVLFAAGATGGRPLARSVRRLLLAYPNPPALPVADPNLRIPSLGDLVSASTGRRFGDRGHRGSSGSREADRRFEEALAMLLDSEDADALQRLIGSPEAGMTFAIRMEYAFHARLSESARRVARRATGRGPSRRSLGSLAGGIDWKATLASFATGEDDIYVHEAPKRSRAARSIGATTPTVFMLGTEHEIDQSVIAPIMDANPVRDALNRGIAQDSLNDSAQPDHVFSVVAAVHSRRRLHADHVREESLSAIGFLCSSPLMGPARYALITRRPARLQCRTDPDFEDDFSGMSKSERIVAWAVKYGEGAVIVVAAPGWKPSQRVARYARERRVEILPLPLSTFPAQVIERLRRMNLVSRNLKQHPRREEILECLLE